jgi:hypothetical protein
MPLYPHANSSLSITLGKCRPNPVLPLLFLADIAIRLAIEKRGITAIPAFNHRFFGYD